VSEIDQGIYTVGEVHRMLHAVGWKKIGAYRLLLIAQRPSGT
jgi:hypothetical protein